MMDCSRGGCEGPAILQLHKWGSSEFHPNLSEFREAFISPRRELLLLLSHQCEALLLPLINGESITCKPENDCSPSSLSTIMESSCLDLRDNAPCTSRSNSGNFAYSKFPSSNAYPFVCDVNSLAWGVCEDKYNQHKGATFGELLFVSGNRGVTVHAFSQPDKSKEMIDPILDVQLEQGAWVEWGPSARVHDIEEQEHSRLHSDTGDVPDVDRMDEDVEVLHEFRDLDGDDELINNSTSKKWLNTFLTKVETMEYDGNICTRFPDKQSIPCSAKVVSFSIFDRNSLLIDLVSRSTSVSNKNDWKEAAPDPLSDSGPVSDSSSSILHSKPDALCNFLNAGMNNSCKCFRVFSSNSHHLIGFVLTMVDPVAVSNNDASERSLTKFLVAVARIDSCGIQWLCSVKLDVSSNKNLGFDWTDFQFSEDLLLCLNAYGSISIYNAITGEDVVNLDILHICGICHVPILKETEQLHAEDDLAHKGDGIKVKHVHEGNAKSTHVIGKFGKRTFRRLIVASGTTLLAAVDECGVVYLIFASDHMPEKYSPVKNLPPHHQPLELGLVGWEVGGFDIGHQRLFNNIPGSHYSECPSLRLGRLPSNTNNGSNKLPEKDTNLQSRRDQFYLPSHLRNIYLPTKGFSEDDFVWCSPLGITRLVKKETMKGPKSFQIIHSQLHVNFPVNDDRSLKSDSDLNSHQGTETSYVGQAVGCVFQGHFYLVTQDGLSVILPSVAVSSNYFPVESIGYRQSRISKGIIHDGGDIFQMKETKQPWSPWKVEVLDRVLLYEGPAEADRLCLENGWDLKISRIRRLQMALDYLKFDEIEQSLEMLLDIDLAEEGILRLVLAAVFLMFSKVGNDSEVSAASRLLGLASCYATRMIRKYGLVQYKKNASVIEGIEEGQIVLSPVLPYKEKNAVESSRKLWDMSQFLAIIRNLQFQLSLKLRRPGQELVDAENAFNLMDSDLPQDVLSADAMSLDSHNRDLLALPAHASDINSTEELGFMPVESLDIVHPDTNSLELSAIAPRGEFQGRKVRPLENPKDMMNRWEMDNMDFQTIVRDALLSGRLPLAVLQLHLHRSKDLVAEKEPHDTFSEVRDVGRAIAYDLFLKGETGLATATLQRLGEDIEMSLKQLMFGTVRKSLRVQIAEEMTRFGYLGPYEWKLFERISVLERLYPSSSFWRTFTARKKELTGVSSNLNSPGDITLCISDSHLFKNLFINCGEVDGVVLGSWIDVNVNSDPPAAADGNFHGGYWAAAAVWSDAWDEKTFDRMVLDQPSDQGVSLPWDSQLEYHVCHNNWDEVLNLLDMIPTFLLSSGSIQIRLDCLPSASINISDPGSTPDYGKYICSVEELDAVFMDVPNIQVLKVPSNNGSLWLMTLMEQELAKKFIFMKEYWEGTAEIIPLLAHSGFITGRYKNSSADDPMGSSNQNGLYADGEFQEDTVRAFHKLVVRHSVRYNLPNFLNLYLDHKMLDGDTLCSLPEAAEDCQWAKWLLLSRIKGREYEASFSNSRSIMSQNPAHGNNLGVMEVDDIIFTVDDIAEGGGEMAALATLMYAPVLIQNCLSSGSVNRHHNSSAQCTLENLRPILQKFPTLWRTLVASCFGQDITCNYLGPKVKHVIGNSDLSDFLNWRDNIFFSTGRDTSLLQMLPGWFPKAVRRLVQLYVQGPLGWQSLAGLPIDESFLNHDIDFIINGNQHTEVSPVSWEAAIQKRVEEELYDSSLKVTGLGTEHHLHRGRPLAAFNHLLGVRIQKLKTENGYQEKCTASAPGQTNVQSDVQALLAPVAQNEVSLLSSVIPLAIMHFEDSMLVASCAFLLELCGLSASMLRVDISALKRISTFYKSLKSNEHYSQLSSRGSAFHTESPQGDIADSLAQALADAYLHHDNANNIMQKGTMNSITCKQPSRALMLVLQHLEKASLPLKAEEKTCGTWLSSDIGDGTEFRLQQQATSQHWNLVSIFCQMHHIPLSTKYLAVLARDNDWVGFLSEAQIGGYSFDVVSHVASKEFSDPKLRIHIVTVLKGMQSKKKVGSSLTSDQRNETSFLDESIFLPVELFRILAECEKHKNPGEALLIKAKDMCWSILALVASCFPDVSSLSCLTVWLEITAARETSSIKVNDISSQIAKNVGAAVEVTNSLPAGSRAIAYHYNWRNPKRRRLMEPMSVKTMDTSTSDVTTTPGGIMRSAQDIVSEHEKEKSTGAGYSSDSTEGPASLSKMVAVLCEQHLFLPLLRAFEMFLPSCSLLPFIRALQAYSQMRLSDASAHLGSFSFRIKEEPMHVQSIMGREGQIGMSWISSTAVKAAEAMLSTCPSPYEKRCLLQLLADTDFGDGGSAATNYRRLFWKINLAEPALRKEHGLNLGSETLDDASLLRALEKNGHWEQARKWARQLETGGGPWKSAVHHVTETQAESMVAEWKEFLWDVPEERVALWGHCQMLFLRYSFPALQAGIFFLKHAEAVEKDLPVKELHDLLLLSLQWLSGSITQSTPVYPLHLLREIETRVWLLAVESEAQVNSEGDFTTSNSRRDFVFGNSSSIIDRTASEITKMDTHINAMSIRTVEKNESRENNQTHYKNAQVVDTSFSTTTGGSTKAKRRAKGYLPSKRFLTDSVEKTSDSEDTSNPPYIKNDLQIQEEYTTVLSFSRWEESVGPKELERAVLSLLEFGQITAAKQLQNKLSPTIIPSEFKLVDVALRFASLSNSRGEVSVSMLDEEAKSILRSYDILIDHHLVYPLQVLETIATSFVEGSGRGLCKRIIAVLKAANLLGLPFSEAFDKQPIEVLQLLSLKAQDSFDEAKLLVQTHSMPAASIAQILAESFLKGLLAAHRGGYMDSQKEEGPAPLLWRFSDFMKWAELCPSEPEVGHALMRLVITGQEIPHACEVELLILSHHFYKSSACLDGVDVLVALAATRVETYVSEGDFTCLAHLITGVGNFYALNFILGILIENGQLDLLLQKYSAAANTNTGTAETVQGFRMAILTSLKHFNPNDLEAFAMVYNHFDMKHETASLLESRASQSSQQWFLRSDKDQNEDLLQSMRYYIEAAEVHSSIDAGNKTCKACAQASLVSLQIRMPDFTWLSLSETNARRALVEQSCFQEALIVAEAYNLNQPSEWGMVLWNQMLKPELTEEFVAEFVAVLPLQPSMLSDLSKFYRAELAARGDQSQFSVWLTGGGLPGDWAKYLGRSFRCLLKRTRDLRLRLQLATVATGFGDVIDSCLIILDKVPDTAGPLVLRKGHGGAYLPLM